MTTLERESGEAFAERMVDLLNQGFLGLMSSIGHSTGLYDTMAGLESATSEQLADAAGLNERYVREWLGAMVTGRIVEYDPAAGTYSLPPERAAVLTRAAGPDNIAVMHQWLSVMGSVEPKVAEAFRNGGGVPYAEFPRFQPVMAEQNGLVFDHALIPSILPLVSGLREKLEEGARVLDVGCGSGHASVVLAETFPNSHFLGYDISEEAIATGKAEIAERGLGNVELKVQDVAAMTHVGEFDLITTFDAVHDQVDPESVLSAIWQGLKDDGTYLMVDIAASSDLAGNIDHPLGPMMYGVSTLHCMTVSLAHGGAGLGTAWGRERAAEMLTAAGFSQPRVEQLEGDVWNYYYIASKA